MEQGEQSGSEQAYIRGEKLDLHAQEIFRKREVVRSDRDGIPRFSEGRKIERDMSDREKVMNLGWITKTSSLSSLQAMPRRRSKTPGGWRRMGEGR